MAKKNKMNAQNAQNQFNAEFAEEAAGQPNAQRRNQAAQQQMKK
jgi:hypothetical protein